MNSKQFCQVLKEQTHGPLSQDLQQFKEMMNTIASNMTGEERVEFEAYAKILGEYLPY